jgi:hypothetical protein
MQGAKFVGDSVSSFFAELDQTRALKSNEFEVEAYLVRIMIMVALNMLWWTLRITARKSLPSNKLTHKLVLLILLEP